MKLLILIPATVDGPGGLETLWMLNLMVNIIPFIMTAISYFCIARRRKIKGAWLAIIPLVNLWVLGSISDHYQWRVNGIRRRFRIWLPVSAVAMVSLIAGLFAGLAAIPAEYFETEQGLMVFSLSIMIMSFLIMGIFMAFMALRFIVLYDLYRSSLVKHSVTFLLLSILVGITEPFLIFYCRNKDHGLNVPGQILAQS